MLLASVTSQHRAKQNASTTTTDDKAGNDEETKKPPAEQTPKEEDEEGEATFAVDRTPIIARTLEKKRKSPDRQEEEGDKPEPAKKKRAVLVEAEEATITTTTKESPIKEDTKKKEPPVEVDSKDETTNVTQTDEEAKEAVTAAETTPPFQVGPSRDDYWNECFKKVDDFYKVHGHLTIPWDSEYKKMAKWLSYQRCQAKSLRPDQLELLNRIGFMNSVKKRWDRMWCDRYAELKDIYDKKDSVVKDKRKQQNVLRWVSKQKKLWRLGKLDPNRVQKFTELGIHKDPLRKAAVNKSTKTNDLKWEAHFKKLEKYAATKEDVNQSFWEIDRSLAIWIRNQRIRYKLMKDGKSEMPPDRVEKLENRGFVWAPRLLK